MCCWSLKKIRGYETLIQIFTKNIEDKKSKIKKKTKKKY